MLRPQPVCIHGMHGLGDAIYQRAFVRQFPGAWLRTPWPEIYADLDLKFVRTRTSLRTNTKDEQIIRQAFSREPIRTGRIITVSYGPADLTQGSIIATMARLFGTTARVFDLPDFGPSPVHSPKPLAVIRPATVRHEWPNPARNPDPHYLAQAAALLREHFYVVSVADLQSQGEWLVGEAPEVDLALHYGELTVSETLALVQNAAVVVSGVGWMLPAAICFGTPLFVVQGGCGAHNAPHIVTDPQMDLSRIGWAQPDNYCMCGQRDHDCAKHISGFTDKFTGWLNENVLSPSAK